MHTILPATTDPVMNETRPAFAASRDRFERIDCAARPAPRARNRWLMASVVEDAAVVSRVFDDAERRDPQHRRTWVALVDGNNHQIDRVQAEARARQVDVTIVVDFVHVLECLWKAAWCFYKERRPRRRTLGPRPGSPDPGRAGRPGCRRHPAAGRSGSSRQRWPREHR